MLNIIIDEEIKKQGIKIHGVSFKEPDIIRIDFLEEETEVNRILAGNIARDILANKESYLADFEAKQKNRQAIENSKILIDLLIEKNIISQSDIEGLI